MWYLFDWFLCHQNQAEIEKFKSEEVEMASQRKALLKDLEDNLSSSTEQAEQYDTQYKQSKKILEQLKSGEYKSTDFWPKRTSNWQTKNHCTHFGVQMCGQS